MLELRACTHQLCCCPGRRRPRSPAPAPSAAPPCRSGLLPSAPEPLADLYLNAVRDAVTGILLETPSYPVGEGSFSIDKALPFNLAKRQLGRDWPLYGVTMVGDQAGTMPCLQLVGMGACAAALSATPSPRGSLLYLNCFVPGGRAAPGQHPHPAGARDSGGRPRGCG